MKTMSKPRYNQEASHQLMAIPQFGNSGEEREKQVGSVNTQHLSGAHLNISEGSLEGRSHAAAHCVQHLWLQNMTFVLRAPIIHTWRHLHCCLQTRRQHSADTSPLCLAYKASVASYGSLHGPCGRRQAQAVPPARCLALADSMAATLTRALSLSSEMKWEWKP